MMDSPQIALVGYGKLARALGTAFVRSGLHIDRWVVRNTSYHAEVKEKYGISASTDVEELTGLHGVIWIAVTDDAIEEVASTIDCPEAILCHCSGMTPLQAISNENRAVFYPLNTFSDHQEDWDENTPIFIQSEDDPVFERLKNIAKGISSNIYRVGEKQRQVLHLSAVISQNFSNYLIGEAEKLLDFHQIDRRLIQPLLHSMLRNITRSPASENQTGPAQRDDRSTIEQHRKLLRSNKELLEIYDLLTKNISRR